MLDEREDTREEPTPEIQDEFNLLWPLVLAACDEIVFGTADSRERFAEIMGGQDKVDRYYHIRETYKVELPE